jgi:uncharacterized DUF497 family protein
MRFTWDEHKSRQNRVKHRVSFETAVLVFDDPYAVSVQDRVVDGEERWQTVGLVGGVTVLLVAHTTQGEHGEEIVHIISARKATPHERRTYERRRKEESD